MTSLTSGRLTLTANGYTGPPDYEVRTWYAVWTMAGTPQPIVAGMAAELAKALSSARLKTSWALQEAIPGPLTPDGMGGFVHGEIARWAGIAKETTIRIEQAITVAAGPG